MASAPSPKGRSWIWYFVAVALLGVILLGWLWLYVQQQLEPGQQLHLEQLAAARSKWKGSDIKDYQMLYTVTRGGEGGGRDRFFVVVKGGKVQSVVMNGDQHLPPEQYDYRSMDGLFNDIDRFLHIDAKEGAPQTFCRGYFDADDGHLTRFVRRVVGTKESVDIRVEEFKPSAAR
jgi:hypothetical protein